MEIKAKLKYELMTKTEVKYLSHDDDPCDFCVFHGTECPKGCPDQTGYYVIENYAIEEE